MKKNALIGLICLWLSAHTLVIGMEDGKRSEPEREKEKEYETPPSNSSQHELDEGEKKTKSEWSAEAQTELFDAMTESIINRVWQGIHVHMVDELLDAELAGTAVDLEKARRALENGADPNSWRGLHFGLFDQDEEEIYEEEFRGELSRPLLLASQIGNIELAKLLIEYGAHIDLPDVRDVTPLENAIYNGYYQLARIFLEHGAAISFEHICVELAKGNYKSNPPPTSLDFFKLLIAYGFSLHDHIRPLSPYLLATLRSLNEAIQQLENPQELKKNRALAQKSGQLADMSQLTRIAHLAWLFDNAEDPQFIANYKMRQAQLSDLAWELVSCGAFNSDELLPILRTLVAKLNMPELLQAILFDTDKALESLKKFTNPDTDQPHDISLVNASLTLASAYGNLQIIAFIVENLRSFLTDDIIDKAFARAALSGQLPALHILRLLISDDRLLTLITENLQIIAAQQREDVVIYLMTLAEELPTNPRIDILPISNFLSILLRNQKLPDKTKNNYLRIQNFLWSYLLNRIANGHTPNHLSQLPPELHFHLAKFIGSGKFSKK